MTGRKTGTREEWLASRRELFRPCGIPLTNRETERRGKRTRMLLKEAFPNGAATDLTTVRD